MCHITNYFNCWRLQPAVVWEVGKGVCESKIHQTWAPVRKLVGKSTLTENVIILYLEIFLPVMKGAYVEEVGDVHLSAWITVESPEDLFLAGYSVVAKCWNNTSL